MQRTRVCHRLPYCLLLYNKYKGCPHERHTAQHTYRLSAASCFNLMWPTLWTYKGHYNGSTSNCAGNTCTQHLRKVNRPHQHYAFTQNYNHYSPALRYNGLIKYYKPHTDDNIRFMGVTIRAYSILRLRS